MRSRYPSPSPGFKDKPELSLYHLGNSCKNDTPVESGIKNNSVWGNKVDALPDVLNGVVQSHTTSTGFSGDLR